MLRTTGWCAFSIAALCLLLTGCDTFTSPDKRVERARAHLEQASYREAMTELKGALERDANHIEARALLAELSLWLDDLEGADKEIDRALQAGAPLDRVRETRYRVLVERGDFEKLAEQLKADTGIEPARRFTYEARIEAAANNRAVAAQKIASGLELAPKDPELLFLQAQLQMAENDTKAALALPEAVAGNDLWQARAQQLRGTVLLRQAKYAEARDAFAASLETGRKALPVREQLVLATALTEVHLSLNEVPAAQESLKVLTSWAPSSLMAHYLRARIAMAKGDGATAVAESQRALALSPEHVPSQLLLAAAHLTQKSYEQAEAVLDGVIAANPQNAAARKLLAQVQLGRNRPDLAQQALSPGGQAGDSDPQMAWLMGVALLQGGSNAEGINYLERGYAGMQGDATRTLELASAYLARGAADKALPLLKEIPAGTPAYQRAQTLTVLATAIGKPPAEAKRQVSAMAANSQDAGVLAAAASVFVRLNDIPRGRELLERAIKVDPKSVLARFTLAGVAVASGDVARARTELGEILRIDPAYEPAHIALSELAWREGDRAGARKHLEAAVAAAPGSVDARIRLAQISFIDGDPARGKDLLDQAVQVATEHGTALHAAGRALAAAGFTDEALARLQQASAAGVDEALLTAAQVQLGVGRTADARQLVQAALERRPKWIDAQGLLVRIDVRDGQLDRARALAREMPRPDGVTVTEIDGDLDMLAGKPDDALKLYESAQRTAPTARLAMKMFNLRRAMQAPHPERSLVEWLERKPQDPTVRRLLAQHYSGAGQRNEAIANYERLAKEPNADPAVLNNLAWMLAESGDARAVEIAKRAHEAAPGVPEIADTYGWILVRSDKVADGLAVLERALAAAPTNPDVQFHAAAAYAKNGQNARAVELLRQALQPGREFAGRAEAEQLLQSLSAKES